MRTALDRVIPANPDTIWRRFRRVLLTMMLVNSLPANGENLWDVYRLALQNDAMYLAAKIDYEAALVNFPLAETIFKPTVTGTGTLGKTHGDASGSTRTVDNHEAGVRVNFSLYNRPERIQLEQAKLEVQGAELAFEIAHDELILRVAERYFNLLATQDAREVARLQKIAIKRQMDLAEERLEVGFGTRTDLFDARARYQQADADLIAADIEISNARQALIEMIRFIPQSVALLQDGSPLETPEPNHLEHWLDLAHSSNLAVKSAAINLQVANYELDRQRALRHPVVDLEANQRWFDNDSNSAGTSYSSSSLEVNLNVPLYAGGRAELRILQAGLRANAAEQSLEAARRQAVTSTKSAFLALSSGISQITALAEAVVAGENALRAKDEGFQAGLTTNLDVLDAQRDLSRSRTNYLRARYNYFLSVLRLEQATGDLGDEDIQFINNWLTGPKTVKTILPVTENLPPLG